MSLQISAIKQHYKPTFSSHRNIRLHSRQTLKVTLPANTTIKVRTGMCWLTIKGQLEDVILQPGQVWNALCETETLLSALGERNCELEIGNFVAA